MKAETSICRDGEEEEEREGERRGEAIGGASAEMPGYIEMKTYLAATVVSPGKISCAGSKQSQRGASPWACYSAVRA